MLQAADQSAIPAATAAGGESNNNNGGRSANSNASFVRANQEKIVVCLTAAVSLGLVGVLVIVIGRMVRSYQHRLLVHSHAHAQRGGSSSLVLSSLASGQSAVDLDSSSLVEELELEPSGGCSDGGSGGGGGRFGSGGEGLHRQYSLQQCAATAISSQQPQQRRRPSFELEPLPSRLEAALYLEGRCPPAALNTAVAVSSLYGTVQRRPAKGILKNARSTPRALAMDCMVPASAMDCMAAMLLQQQQQHTPLSSPLVMRAGDDKIVSYSNNISGGDASDDVAVRILSPANRDPNRLTAADWVGEATGGRALRLLHMEPLDNRAAAAVAAVDLSYRAAPLDGPNEGCDGSRDQLFLL